jgi:hypothetical protein
MCIINLVAATRISNNRAAATNIMVATSKLVPAISKVAALPNKVAALPNKVLDRRKVVAVELRHKGHTVATGVGHYLLLITMIITTLIQAAMQAAAPKPRSENPGLIHALILSKVLKHQVPWSSVNLPHKISRYRMMTTTPAAHRAGIQQEGR